MKIFTVNNRRRKKNRKQSVHKFVYLTYEVRFKTLSTKLKFILEIQKVTTNAIFKMNIIRNTPIKQKKKESKNTLFGYW